jgi:glycosyltransferase involved in cell wall biosynthesis
MSELTIAIPYYRGREYLERAIRSVLRQRDGRWRLLVADDRGAEPDLEAFVHALGGPRASYLRHTGPADMVGNWNRCLDSAPTDLVTLLHADDELLEDYCSLMHDSARRHPEAVGFFCAARVIDPAGDECFSFPDYVKRWLVPQQGVQVLRGEAAVRALLWGNFIMCPTLCYRKSRLAGRRFATRWRQVQDLEFTTRLLMEGEELVGLPRACYAYRRHPGNATARYTENLLRFEEESALYNELRRHSARKGWGRAAFLARLKVIVRLHLGYCLVRDLARGRVGAAWRKLDFLARGCPAEEGA